MVDVVELIKWFAMGAAIGGIIAAIIVIWKG